ncbi:MULTISPECIES: hypothetical protein [Clostridium]|nr:MULTISPECIES: hypothetical protein [Clostridium]
MCLKDIEFYGLTEPYTNSLRMYFDRCKVSDTPEDFVIVDKIITDCYPINIDAHLPTLQLDFESYIAYSITNESFTSWDDYEVFEGNAFRIYTKSRYLDFIKEHTFAHQVCGDVYPTLTHYGIVCLNHIVNIVSTCTPVIVETNKR